MNEELPSFKEAVAMGNTPFPRNLSSIDFAEGVMLVMRAADRNYFLLQRGLSFGMYLNVLREEMASGRGGATL